MKGLPVNVRLDDDVSKRLEQVATLSGLDKSTLIRIAVSAFLKELDNNDGKIVVQLTAPKARK